MYVCTNVYMCACMCVCMCVIVRLCTYLRKCTYMCSQCIILCGRVLLQRVLKQIVQNTADREGSRYKSKVLYMHTHVHACTHTCTHKYVFTHTRYTTYVRGYIHKQHIYFDHRYWFDIISLSLICRCNAIPMLSCYF